MTIVYQKTLAEFYEDQAAGIVADMLAGAGHESSSRGSAQYRAWENSLVFMESMLKGAKVSGDCGVLIEYRLPSTSRRVDFIVTGHDVKGDPNFVIIELKQWSWADVVREKPGIVVANVAGSRNEETNHPCYQAWSYKVFLENMLNTVEEHHLQAHACAYMHNYPYKGFEVDPLAADPNHELVRDTPLFGQYDRRELGDFVSQYVGRGDGEAIMELLADGKIVPGKGLVDAVSGMFDEVSPRSFTLIDEQKLAYETVMDAVRTTPVNDKHCVIIAGGPGTGKSVVAMSALVAILREFRNNEKRRNVRFVSPTSSFRIAMVEMLTSGCTNKKEKARRNALAKNLFCGSMGFFTPSPVDPKVNGFTENYYHCLLCDESHRLHSYQNMYRGTNQIEDIIQAACVSVFFVDDNQALRPNDIGSVASIEKAAQKYSAKISRVDLAAQFRCRGAEGFLNWLAVVLGLADADTAGNAQGWDKESFDFDVVDTPEEVIAFVNAKNKAADDEAPIAGQSIISGARLLAGYAWSWTKEENSHGEVADVDLGSVKLPWNNRASSYKWAVDPDTKERNEVGCVHTSQGLEFDWVGVFIGKDLRYDPEKKILYADLKKYFDTGGKNGLGKTPAERAKNLLPYVCRCYRVLLSRGVRGARVYCCDPNLAAYLKAELAKAQNLKVSE